MQPQIFKTKPIGYYGRKRIVTREHLDEIDKRAKPLEDAEKKKAGKQMVIRWK